MRNSLLKKIGKTALFLPIIYFLNTKELTAPEIKDKTIKDPRKTVILDPGHGMSNKKWDEMDWGGAKYKEYKEADIVLKQAKKIKEMLNPSYYNVILTREKNEDNTPIAYRSILANKANADVFISLHLNYNKKANLGKFEVYYREDKSEELVKLAIKNLKEMTPIPKGRIEKEEYFVLKDLNCPGILIESGYLRNKENRKYILDTIPDIEKAIAKTIEDYLK